MKINTKLTEHKIKNPVFDKISRVGNLYFASKIMTPEVYPYLKSLGITNMVDFKHPSDNPLPEDELATQHGIKYDNVLVQACMEINDTVLAKMEDIIEKSTGNILIYCNSANRVSAWLAIHLVKNENYSVARAIEVAKVAGLDKEETEQGVLNNLNSTAKSKDESEASEINP